MRILAFEAIGSVASVALLEGDVCLATRTGNSHTTQGEFLLPAIKDVLAEADCALKDIGGLAVCTGVGSFTGIRIGLSAAYGLSLAANIPLVGVTVFEALAHQHPKRTVPLAVLVESAKTFYLQCFAPDNTALFPPRLVQPEELFSLLPTEAFMRTGNGWEVLGGIEQYIETPFNAESIARAAKPLLLNAKNGSPLAWPMALYIKESYAKPPRPAPHSS